LAKLSAAEEIKSLKAKIKQLEEREEEHASILAKLINENSFVTAERDGVREALKTEQNKGLQLSVAFGAVRGALTNALATLALSNIHPKIDVDVKVSN
jgi:regulator of replication initiation timing